MKMVHGVQIFPNQHPLALITQDNHCRVRKIDPTWASHQTCWNCSKIGHIHQKCTMSQAEKQAYQEKKYGDYTKISAQVSTDPELYIAQEVIEDIALKPKGLLQN